MIEKRDIPRMLRLKKPPHLEPGDTVAAVSLSWGGPGTYPHRYQAGKRQFEEAFGVRVVETPHALRDAEWLARNPKARADDLMEAFSDPSVRAIISTIGGDDSVRILRHLDLDVLRDHPKLFVGYSDSTVTHFACLARGPQRAVRAVVYERLRRERRHARVPTSWARSATISRRPTMAS